MNVDRNAPYKLFPREHQFGGMNFLLHQPSAALFDEMGVGKSAQVIGAACHLWRSNTIDTVVVVAPAGVRGVWDDPDFGEIQKHVWDTLPWHVHRYDSANRFLPRTETRSMLWVTTSYSYIRQKEATLNLGRQLKKNHGRILLVFDESVYLKNHRAAQTKMSKELRRLASRVIILNGTPAPESLMDLWSQFDILNPTAIREMNYFKFRGTYAIMGGFQNKQIVGYQTDRVETLKKQLAPYILRRLKTDCTDLPPKIYTHMEVPMNETAWSAYQTMRADMIARLNEAASIAVNGGVKAMRLSQITSGFLGGMEGGADEWDTPRVATIEEIDTAKLDAVIEWAQENKTLPVLFWCRFTAEIERLAAALNRLAPTGMIYGKNIGRREEVVNAFQQGRLQYVVGHPRAGGYGLTLTRAATVVYVSNDYSLVNRLQSEDRAHRTGQVSPVTYIDVLATSPGGRKTIDHVVLKKLRAKEDMHKWTTNEWRSIVGDL